MTSKSISLSESDLTDFKVVLLTALTAAFKLDDGISNKDIRKIWRIDGESEKIGSGQMSLQTEYWRHYRTRAELMSALQSMPETSLLNDFISERFPNSGLKIRSGRHELPLQEGLGILTDFCWRRRKKDFSPGQLVNELSDVLQRLSKQQKVKIKFEYSAVIAALDLPLGIDELQLSSEIKIRRLSKQEREEIAFDPNAGVSTRDGFNALRFRVALIYEFEQELVLEHGATPPESEIVTRSPHSIVEATLKTLNLFFDGNPIVAVVNQRSI